MLAPRVFGCRRARAAPGLSHHTLAVLELVRAPVRVAWPAGLDVPELGPVEIVDASSARRGDGLPPLAHGTGPRRGAVVLRGSLAADLARAIARNALTFATTAKNPCKWGRPDTLVRLSLARVMRIGVAKEIKQDEYRVALTPAGAGELRQAARGFRGDRRRRRERFRGR